MSILNALDGYKTYILAAIGVLVILANHFLGPVPGTPGDSANWLSDIWAMLLVAAGRSAVNKIPSNGGQ